MAPAETRLVDQLPGVVRGQDAAASDFLERFLEPFEQVQRAAHREVDHVPDLFSVAPTPYLRTAAIPGTGVLRLDSAAGIRAGDRIEVRDEGESPYEYVHVRDLRVEWRIALRAVEPSDGTVAATPRFEHDAGTPLRVVDGPAADGEASASLLEPATTESRVLRVASARDIATGDVVETVDLDAGRRERFRVGEAVVEEQDQFVPRYVGLEPQPARPGKAAAGPRYDHPPGTPVRLLGREVATVAMAISTDAGATAVTLEAPDVLPVAAGDVVRVDDGDSVEYALVTAVDGAVLTLAPALELGHVARRPVALVERAPTTTPSPESFPRAQRSGPELVLQAAVRQGEKWLELDSVSGLKAGDRLRLLDRNRDQYEDVRIASLPEEEPPHPVVAPGALLELDDRDSARVEYVRADTVAEEESASADLASRQVRLAGQSTPTGDPRPVPAFAHSAGTPVRSVGEVRADGKLAARAEAGERSVTTTSVLPAQPGDVLRIGSGEAADHLRIAGPAGATLQLDRPLSHAVAAGSAVAVLAGPDPRAPVSAFLRGAAIAGHPALSVYEATGVIRRSVTLDAPLQFDHDAGIGAAVIDPSGDFTASAGTGFLRWLARWIGLELRPDRGERWNRELVRVAGRIWPWRTTGRGTKAFLALYLRGEAERADVVDAPNPMQIGVTSTIGVDTAIGGMPPHFFELEVETDPRNGRMYAPEGLRQMIQAARAALTNERPAHTYYDVRLFAHTMQIGVDADTEIGARVGDTTLLWRGPLVVPGER